MTRRKALALKRVIQDENIVIRLVNASSRSRLSAFVHEADTHMDANEHAVEETNVATRLVSRIREGDAAAESELVQRYGVRLRYVLQRQMSRYPHDLDDVVQETLTTALLRLRHEGIENPARLGGFIYGIARNLRLARLRDHARYDGEAGQEILPIVPDDGVRPDRMLAGVETTQIVRRLLAELGSSSGSERDREVLLRLYIRQQTRDEVCEALEIPPDHLRRVIHRAKQRLKALLLESVSGDALGLASDD